MSKVAYYLQEHLMGEVTASPEVRRHFAQDASVLRLAPAIVVYPRNETDVRKTARFAWQLAERGSPVPITARGGGSDTSGAAIGNGIMMVFTAHMQKILAFDPKKQTLVVEPGATYDKIEQTLFTHGFFLPPYPASQNYATIGGSIINNSIGEKSVKYGSTGEYVQSLRVVLANGEVIETGPLSKRELNHKMGLQTFEGEIYRSMDRLLEENHQLVANGRQHIQSRFNSVGYNIFDIKRRGDFDLTPLIIGSQGSLGLVSEATLHVAAHNPLTSLAIVSLDRLESLASAMNQIMKLGPSVFDMVNQGAITQVLSINPNQLAGVLARPDAEVHLFIEFDDLKEGEQKKKLKELRKIVDASNDWMEVYTDLEGQDRLWKIRHSVTTLLTQPKDQSKAVPVAEDVTVPLDRLVEYMSRARQVYADLGLIPAMWGHPGIGVIRMEPVLDLAQTGDRQKLFKIAESLYAIALELGGSFSAAAGDGRVRAPYITHLYGQQLYDVMLMVKKIFDPHNILNPGVKTATGDEVKTLLRGDYGLEHHHAHLPRS